MKRIMVGGRDIELKNLNKVWFPDAGISKGDVVDYYLDLADIMMMHLSERPLTLQRFPDGIDAEGFYQQQRPDYFPAWVEGVSLPRAGGGDDKVHHIVCGDAPTLVYLANQGVITFHGWLSRAGQPHHPDRLVFDLDPAGDDFTPVRAAARRVAGLMTDLGMTPFVMTTGSRGLHVVAPLDGSGDFDAARACAHAMAARLAREYPDELTTEQRKDKREGRLYLDVMRNAYGQTAVVPYALRPLPGAPVATPLDWDELDRSELGPQRYHLGNLRQRLGQKQDPWRDMNRHRVAVARARERLDGGR
ncbi:MAG: non-homologous end-joining DNA ligase [Gammaproteobacteria bacterium]|nr:non-homologous end-joining DNA ligase [Gammaproteobacteria bacterium]